jgi:hypothetical protein
MRMLSPNLISRLEDGRSTMTVIVIVIVIVIVGAIIMVRAASSGPFVLTSDIADSEEEAYDEHREPSHRRHRDRSDR